MLLRLLYESYDHCFIQRMKRMLSYEYYELFCEYKYQMPSVDQIVQR